MEIIWDAFASSQIVVDYGVTVPFLMDRQIRGCSTCRHGAFAGAGYVAFCV